LNSPTSGFEASEVLTIPAVFEPVPAAPAGGITPAGILGASAAGGGAACAVTVIT